MRFLPTNKHARIVPYVGGGVDAVFYKYEEFGDFIDFYDARRNPIIPDHFHDSGTAFGFHAVGGLRVYLNRDFAIVGEGRYQWAKTTWARTSLPTSRAHQHDRPERPELHRRPAHPVLAPSIAARPSGARGPPRGVTGALLCGSACYDGLHEALAHRRRLPRSPRRLDSRGRRPRRARARRERAPERPDAALHRDDGRGRAAVRRRGPDRPARLLARSARCSARWTPTRTSSSRRTTRRCRSARRASTTASASRCSRSTATSPSSSPFEGTPAHRLGIRAGDVISRIEGEDARGHEHRRRGQAPARAEGHAGADHDRPPGLRGAARVHGHPRRDPAPLRPVLLHGRRRRSATSGSPTSTRRRPAGPARATDCERELEKALRELKRAGATAFILDIRDNPGGLLDQAFAVSNLFLKKGQLVVFTRGRTRRDESNYITEEESPWSQRAARGPHLAAQRERQRDRGRGAAGPRPRADRRGDDVRQGPRADDHAAAQRARLRARPHHGPLLHAVGPLDPARLRARPRSRSTTRRATARRARSGSSDPKLTDAGRKVYGGDGITPDYCVEPEAPNKFVSYLIARQAFTGFARGFEAAEGQGQADDRRHRQPLAQRAAKVTVIGKDFRVDDEVLKEFGQYLDTRKLRHTEADLQQNRDELVAPPRGGGPAPGVRRGRGAPAQPGLGPPGEEGARGHAARRPAPAQPRQPTWPSASASGAWPTRRPWPRPRASSPRPGSPSLSRDRRRAPRAPSPVDLDRSVAAKVVGHDRQPCCPRGRRRPAACYDSRLPCPPTSSPWRPRPQPEGRRRHHPHPQARRGDRRVGLRQEQPRVRHPLRRGAAAVRREPLLLRAAVPRAHGEAAGRRGGGDLPGDRDPAAHAVAQPALDRGHRHRDPRPPAAAVRARRADVLRRAGRRCGATRPRPWPSGSAGEPEGTRLLVGFEPGAALDDAALGAWRRRGCGRLLVGDDVVEAEAAGSLAPGARPLVLVDRVVVREDDRGRLADSLEAAFREGGGRAVVARPGGGERTSLSERFECRRCGKRASSSPSRASSRSTARSAPARPATASGT